MMQINTSGLNALQTSGIATTAATATSTNSAANSDSITSTTATADQVTISAEGLAL